MGGGGGGGGSENPFNCYTQIQNPTILGSQNLKIATPKLKFPPKNNFPNEISIFSTEMLIVCGNVEFVLEIFLKNIPGILIFFPDCRGASGVPRGARGPKNRDFEF